MKLIGFKKLQEVHILPFTFDPDRKDPEPPSQSLEPLPPLPAMKRMTYAKDESGVAVVAGVPDEVVKTWYHHEVHGAEFRRWFDELIDKHGSLQDYIKETQVTTTPGKRAATTLPNTSGSAKKQKVNMEAVSKLVDIKGVQTSKVNCCQTSPRFTVVNVEFFMGCFIGCSRLSVFVRDQIVKLPLTQQLLLKGPGQGPEYNICFSTSKPL